MWYALVIVLCVIKVTVTAYDPNEPLERDAVINAVNNANTSWKAGRNFHPSLTKAQIPNLLGVELPDHDSGPVAVYESEYSVDGLPDFFDAREKWNFCKALQTVRNQGQCGACWAVSTTAAFTDRLCIKTNGSWNGQLSAQQLLSCSGLGSCNGGRADKAFWYFQSQGIVTGGDFGSNEGCQPYLTPYCGQEGTDQVIYCYKARLPKVYCQNKCYNENYKKTIDDDYHAVETIFRLAYDVPAIMREIYHYGPLIAHMEVHEDFYSYMSGVYRHTVGEKSTLHSVEIIGWGEEAGSPYWLVKNSWGSDWGEQGIVKFLRGNNHCGIESSVYGGHVLM